MGETKNILNFFVFQLTLEDEVHYCKLVWLPTSSEVNPCPETSESKTIEEEVNFDYFQTNVPATSTPKKQDDPVVIDYKSQQIGNK